MKVMRTTVLCLAVLAANYNSALAQVYVSNANNGTLEQMKVWSDFLKTDPTDYDFWNLLEAKPSEPYKGWLVQEGIKRNSRTILRHAIYSEYMEEYHDLIWSKGKLEEDIESLIYVINFGSKKNMEKAVNIIIEAPRRLVGYEWAVFWPQSNLDNVSDEKVARLWNVLCYQVYPTDSGLANLIIGTGSKKIQQLAIEELFSRYLPDEKLVGLLYSGSSLELKKLALDRLSSYQMLSKADLETIVSANIEPFSSIAKAMIESDDWEWRRLEKQRGSLLRIITGVRVAK